MVTRCKNLKNAIIDKSISLLFQFVIIWYFFEKLSCLSGSHENDDDATTDDCSCEYLIHPLKIVRLCMIKICAGQYREKEVYHIHMWLNISATIYFTY